MPFSSTETSINGSSSAASKKDSPTILQKENKRYKSKGIGLFFSALQVTLFYLYWPSLMEAFWPKALQFQKDRELTEGQFYFILGITCSYMSLILLNGFYFICYRYEFPLMERYKVYELEWPWKNEDQEEWNQLFWRTVKLYLFNVLILGPLVSAPVYFSDLPVDLDFSVDGIPAGHILVAQICFCMLMEDMTFHMSHRLLHHPRLYPYIHKIHHEHKMTISIAAQYSHPIEIVLGTFKANMGILLLGTRMHMATAFTWQIIRYAESAEAHSGYDFSWSPFRLIPFSSDYAYHSYHHSHNIGNYSSFFTIWDTVWGTNKVYYEYLEEEVRVDVASAQTTATVSAKVDSASKVKSN